MMLVPYAGETPIDAATVSIVTDPDDQKRVDFLVSRCNAISRVDDRQSLTQARRLGGEIKALENEIQNEKKLAKAPFRAIENAIEERAKEIAAPLLQEKSRVSGMLAAYVARLEAVEKEAQQRREAALAAQVAEQQKRIKEAEEARAKAEAEAKAATNDAEVLRASAKALTAKLDAATAQLAREMAEEAARIGCGEPPRGKIPGGRVDHKYEYKVISIRDALKGGFLRLFRWEIDKLACNDEVRAQLDKDPDAEPHIPGFEITRTINVSLRASARIK
jgi:hypothetical protein